MTLDNDVFFLFPKDTSWGWGAPTALKSPSYSSTAFNKVRYGDVVLFLALQSPFNRCDFLLLSRPGLEWFNLHGRPPFPGLKQISTVRTFTGGLSCTVSSFTERGVSKLTPVVSYLTTDHVHQAPVGYLGSVHTAGIGRECY